MSHYGNYPVEWKTSGDIEDVLTTPWPIDTYRMQCSHQVSARVLEEVRELKKSGFSSYQAPLRVCSFFL